MAIVDADIGTSDDTVPIDHKGRGQRQSPGVIPIVGREVDAELEVQRPQLGREAVHQPILPGDGVVSIDDDGKRPCREPGLIEDRIEGVPWRQRADPAAYLRRHRHHGRPERFDRCHGMLESSLLQVAVRSPHAAVEHQD